MINNIMLKCTLKNEEGAHNAIQIATQNVLQILLNIFIMEV